MASSSDCLALGIPTTKPLISTYKDSFLRFSATFPTRTRFSNGAFSVSCCKNMEPVVYLNHDKQQLMVNDRPILKGMTENFTLSSVTEGHGHFLEVNNSAHVVSLGVLSCLSFTASFRRDRWYMARETGDWGDLKWDVLEK